MKILDAIYLKCEYISVCQKYMDNTVEKWENTSRFQEKISPLKLINYGEDITTMEVMMRKYIIQRCNFLSRSQQTN